MRIKITLGLLFSAIVCFFCGCTEGYFDSQQACIFQGVEEISLLASDHKILLIKFAFPDKKVIPIRNPTKEILESLKEIKEGERVFVRYVRPKNGLLGEPIKNGLQIITLDSGKKYSFEFLDVR